MVVKEHNENELRSTRAMCNSKRFQRKEPTRLISADLVFRGPLLRHLPAISSSSSSRYPRQVTSLLCDSLRLKPSLIALCSSLPFAWLFGLQVSWPVYSPLLAFVKQNSEPSGAQCTRAASSEMHLSHLLNLLHFLRECFIFHCIFSIAIEYKSC